jgi:ubiquinone/menaquinone biosynthesis C-methylase UbiE
VTHGREHDPGHDHAHGHLDRHRNPVEFDHYLSRLESPERDAWQKPDRVVAALGLAPGDVACDVGAGPGYLALRMARAVGPRGAVYAIDVEPRMLAILGRRAREAGLDNVRPILSRGPRGALPPRRCRVILAVNAFHHFPGGAAYLRRLAGRLAPGGRIVNVDFHRRELPVGPPPAHKVAREDFVAQARAAGLEVTRERRFLPYQYFLELAPISARAPRPGGRSPATSTAETAAPPSRRARGAPRPGARSTRSRAPSRRSSRRRRRSPGPPRSRRPR